MFDVCPHQLLCKRQRDVRILPMYAETDSSILWHVKFAFKALKGTVTSEVGISSLSHVPMSRSRKVRGAREPRNGYCSSYPSLLRLRRHFPLTVIVAPLVADMLNQCYQ
jgi:hypothetical protein